MFGTKTPVETSDKIIAGSIKAETAVGVQALSAAIATSACPDVKRIFTDYLQQGLVSQGVIDAFLTEKGFIKPFADSNEQLRIALSDVQSMVNPMS